MSFTSRELPSSTSSSPTSAPSPPIHCLVFMRSAFGEPAAANLDRAHKYIVLQLGASELISTRIYYHAHFSSADRLKEAMQRSRAGGLFQPAGAVCLQKQCGTERHSVEVRVKKAGLTDYTSVRRWILANKRVVLYDEVFRDRGEKKDDGDELEKEKTASEEEIKRKIDETQKELGYAALPASERHGAEHHVTEATPVTSPVVSPLASRSSSISTNAPCPATQPATTNAVAAPLPPAPASPQPAAATAATVTSPAKRANPLKVYVKSRQGQSWDPRKINQDRPLACVPLRGHPGVHVYGVMDGHGQYGHYVSEFVMATLPAFLSREQRLREDTNEAVLSAVRGMCAELAQSNINLSFSGTTCCFAVHHSDKLHVANIGDSRALLIRSPDLPNYPPYAIPLSSDHKPDLPGEKARIIAAGGRVCPIPGMDSGPARVWLMDADEPGLAMSRSIGDEVSASVGVTNVPELSVHQLDERDVCLLIASDGVWEFITNDEAARLVWKYIDTPAAAVNQLVAESVRRWQDDSEQVVDDITVVLVMFK